MKASDDIDPHGHFQVNLKASRQGDPIPIQDANLSVSIDELPGTLQDGELVVNDDNLVVNDGRSQIARLLGNDNNHYIDRLILGDGPKSGNLPTLEQSGLVNEIADKDGNKNGKFLIDHDNEVFFPSRTGRFPSDPAVDWGSSNGAISIDNNGHSFLGDSSVNFFEIGVQTHDQITIDNDPSLILQVRQVINEHTIEVYNPNDYETPGGDTIQYRIDTSGTQLLISKLIRGNDFPVSDWGVATIIHEAGLLFNDGTLFNRVVFAAFDDTAGLILQPDTNTHDELSIRFEILVTL